MAVLNSDSFADCPPTLVPPPPRPALPCPPRRQRVLPGGGRQHPAEKAGQEAVPIVRIERGRGGKPHEYPALPGDIHPAQISKAIRCAAYYPFFPKRSGVWQEAGSVDEERCPPRGSSDCCRTG